MFRITWDEISGEISITNHENKLMAIIADQEESGWIVRKMNDYNGATITEFRSDRRHFGVSVIDEDKDRAMVLIENQIVWYFAEGRDIDEEYVNAYIDTREGELDLENLENYLDTFWEQ